MKKKNNLKNVLGRNKNLILKMLGIFLLIIFILFLATSVLPKTLVILSRARFSDKVVISNSYFVGEKILAKSDGSDECIVSVFLLDKNGKAVRGKNAGLIGVENFVSNGVSNADGKITFKLTSTEEKQYRINASYGGQQLSQTIVVTFRK